MRQFERFKKHKVKNFNIKSISTQLNVTYIK